MKCPKCQFKTHDNSKFCSECGYDLRKVKAAFFTDYNRPQFYTPKFLADKILTTKSAFEGERKLVTVLFADVAHSMSIAEKLDPEEVHQIMDGCFKILMDEIHKYEGNINQFRGDGIMALFGAPMAYEKHDQRACYAALGIQNAMEIYSKEIRAKFGLEFKMRIGLNSGLVVVGSIGDDLRMDYTAVGDSTNLASRMESMAEPGSILVTENTYKRVRKYFEFRPLGKFDIKGTSKRLNVYELKDEIDYSRSGPVRKIFSELVGRENELNRLELHLTKVIDGEGSVVNVIGDPGIGKSRLIAELKKKDDIKNVKLLEGRALAIGKNLSFHPIIDILKYWTGIRESDRESETIEKLEMTIRSIYPPEVEELFPFIATLMGMKLIGKHAQRVKGIEGEALEKFILKSLRELIARASETIPVMLIVEDLQWSDLTTIEFLESLFRLASDHPILFINVFRPNYKETSDRLIDTIRDRYGKYSLEINLKPMEEHQCRALIDNLIKVKTVPQPLRESIIKSAEGNPFFIEEVVRSFIDEGLVALGDKDLKIKNKIDSVIIPDTIFDVLTARIDKLDEGTKDLLKIASVIGREFFYKILSEVAKPIENIEKKLEYLKDVQLIRERKRAGEIEYLFKHGLTQEATYGSILLNKRKELHIKVADAIESVFHDKLYKFYGILAYHYSNGENMEKAEEYLIRAGEEALKSSASSEAINYYQEGLKLYIKKYGDAGDRDKMLMFEKNIALAFFNKGRYTDALYYFDRVLEHLGEGLPKNKIVLTFDLICNFLSLVKNLYIPSRRVKKIPEKRDNELLDLIQKKIISLIFLDPLRFFIETLRLLKKVNKFDVTKIENGVSMYTGASALFSWTGISFKLSRKALEYAKKLVKKNNSKELLYYNLFDLIYNFFTGNWCDVHEYDEKLLDDNLGTGQFWQVSTYILFHDLIKVYKGEFRETEKFRNRMSQIWDAYENEIAGEYLLSMKARVLMRSRKLHDALIEANAVISFLSQTGRDMSILYNLGIKAIVQIYLQNIGGAKESLLQAKGLGLKQESVPQYYFSSYLIGQFLLDLYFLNEAVLSNDKMHVLEYRKKAFRSGKNAIKNSKKYKPDKIEVFRLMGYYYWLTGKQKKALKWWNSSIKEGERLGTKADLARTYMEVGRRLLEEKSKFNDLNGIAAEIYLEKARKLFEEMDLQWDLDELDRVITYSRHSILAA